MLSVMVIPSVTLENTSRTVNALALPVGLSRMRLWIDVSQMVSADQWFTYTFELSLDGGTTWGLLIGGTRTGTIAINPKTQTVMTQAGAEIGLPEPANTLRRVRGSLRVTGTVPLSVLLEAV